MNSRLDERRARLEAIERELALLQKKRRALERSWDAARDDDEPVPPLAEAGSGSAAAPVGGDRAGLPERPEERERFASYFMSGNLGRSGSQLKREHRAQRNRAIVMAVFALFLIVVLVRFLIK